MGNLFRSLFRNFFIFYVLIFSLYSSLVFAERAPLVGPSFPFVDYIRMGANTEIRLHLLDAFEILMQMHLTQKKFQGMDQVLWNQEFISVSQFEREMYAVEKKHFEFQLLELGINAEEHPGTPSQFEIEALFKEIKLLKTLLYKYEKRLYNNEQLYQNISSEPQRTLQVKQFYRSEQHDLAQYKSRLEYRLHILKSKIDIYLPFVVLSPQILPQLELAKIAFNELILEVSLTKINISAENEKVSFWNSVLRSLGKQSPPIMSPALFPRLKALFYFEFELNTNLNNETNAKNRMIAFEKYIKHLQGYQYDTQEGDLVLRNGFQEAAYYFARLHQIPVTEDVYTVTNAKTLAEFMSLDFLNTAQCRAYFTI